MSQTERGWDGCFHRISRRNCLQATTSVFLTTKTAVESSASPKASSPELLALSMHCLEHAVQQETIAQQSASDTWSKTIEEDTVKRAVELINHFIEQKFTLMPPEEKHPTCHLDLGLLTTEQSEFVDSKAAWIKKLLQSHPNGCSCKTGCHSKRCGCRKKEQSCGAGCECHGCTNLPLTSLQQQNNMDEDEEIENETEDESENNSEEDLTKNKLQP